MRIGIDATSWVNPRGFGRFTRGLATALAETDRGNEYVLFFDRAYARCEGVPAQARHVVVRTSGSQSDALTLEGRRAMGDILKMTAAVARARLDLFYSPSVDGYFPVFGVPRRIVTIHDAMPEQFGAIMLPSAAARRRRRVKVRFALAQADRIATGSAYMQREIAQVFDWPMERVGVIPYAAEACFSQSSDPASARRAVAERHALDRPYLLHVGGFGPNKNLVRLVDAFAQSGVPDLLVLAGDRRADRGYPEDAALDDAIAGRGLGERVRFLGRVTDGELVRLYQAATAVAVPSLKEGFGLPGLEAVACGTPVIATSASPLPEALGEAAWVVDPLDVTALRHAIAEAHGDARVLGRRRAAALARAERFRWAESARRAVELFTCVA